MGASLMEIFASIIGSSMSAATPLLLAAIGLLVNERAGVLNLGAEGMMLMAAVAGFAVGIETQSVTLAFVGGACAGVLAAAMFGVLTIYLTANQVATGLALSIFGTGLSAFIGQDYVGKSIALHRMNYFGLSELPFFGEAFFKVHPMAYGALVLVALVAWFLFRTRAGLILRAVGESPESAHSLGYKVRRIRFYAVLFGGACCGLAGAFMSVVYTPMWVEGLVSGRGWIALALTTFATWRPLRVLLGAMLFGGITISQFYMQGTGIAIPSQFLAMLPYVGTIVVLVFISRNPELIRLNMPASLGKPFKPGAS
jgi:general nucleoside transport system permease protein